MTGKVAVITGASQGIGACLVAGYRGRGWAVVANARMIKPSEDPDLLTVAGDIADPATAETIIGAALDRFGRIDTLVNNAGVYISKPFTDYTAADYATMVGVNLTGFFWLTQRTIAEMASRYGGHVVNVTATLAEAADSAAPAALAALTKSGLAAATRSLAIEYAAYGIRVNAVSPGIIAITAHPPTATSTSAAGLSRSAGPARSATSWTASCSWSPRPTSPAKSCTSTAARPPGTEAPARPAARYCPHPGHRAGRGPGSRWPGSPRPADRARHARHAGPSGSSRGPAAWDLRSSAPRYAASRSPGWA